MAESVLLFRFTYENNESFKCEKQVDGGAAELIVQIDENAHIKEMWPHIAKICTETIAIDLETIGTEMKKS